MHLLPHTRGLGSGLRASVFVASALVALSCFAQDTSSSPASIPAGLIPNTNSLATDKVSPKQAREADDAYIEGARRVQRNDLEGAIRSFGQAVKLNPANRDYVLALFDAREHKVTELVQSAAKARLAGDNAKADSLLAQARAIDPDNRIVTQHGIDASPWETTVDPLKFSPANIASTLEGAVELSPTAGTQSFHRRGDPQDLLRAVYQAYGITVSFDASVSSGASVRLDLDDVDFATATRILGKMTHTFRVAVQPTLALVAKDTQENRDRLVPQLEETVYLPGLPNDEMSELANVARNIFDLKQVTASATGGNMLLRGDENTLKLVNATFADMLDGGSDVLLNINLYELDKTHTRDIGASLPSSAGVFSIAAEATSLISANQSVLTAAISSGILVLNGTPLQNILKELAFLVGSGAVSATQYTNLLGTFGSGLTYAGLYLGSSSTFNLLLNSSDVRIIDEVTVRGANRQPLNFRSGSRYPVITSTYSSGISSSAASALAGVNINGTSAASLLAQYAGSASSASIPQFQFEDLGITLKTTPQILHTGNVSLALEMKIEALAGGSLNSIPILNSRALTSTITVPVGQTALIVSEVSSTEMRSILGLPGLSELPGFQGTDQNTERDSGELLITITPHIVRPGNLRVASRPMATGPIGPGSAQ
jgi:hypothetical protein